MDQLIVSPDFYDFEKFQTFQSSALMFLEKPVTTYSVLCNKDFTKNEVFHKIS